MSFVMGFFIGIGFCLGIFAIACCTAQPKVETWTELKPRPGRWEFSRN